MPRSDFLGAKASNAGDSFHELWALHAALGLVSPKASLRALTVEGIRSSDDVPGDDDPWSGVDCALYFDGDSFSSASRVDLVQLKYSSATPEKNWTISALTASDSGQTSVVRRLANQFKAAHKSRSSDPDKLTIPRFVSNRPISSEVTQALLDIRASTQAKRLKLSEKRKSNISKLRIASGLSAKEFGSFCTVLSLEGKADSRFALRERLILTIGSWTDTNARTQLDDLLQLIRDHMMPESRRDLISRESILARFGVSDQKSIFPCPPDIKVVANAVPRKQTQDVLRLIEAGTQKICLHGEGGSGKTTLLQEIQKSLPVSSTSIVFDCYGGGTYLNSDGYRHRDKDAFTQLINELAAAFQAPLFLAAGSDSSFAKRFMDRLIDVSKLQEVIDPKSVLLIAIDAADNSISAATSCQPPEPSFVQNVLRLGNLPRNVILIVTGRTGRLELLNLPSAFHLQPIEQFSKEETAAHVAMYWANVPMAWTEEFHELSTHNPRVQYYALTSSVRSNRLDDAMEYLLPKGKRLDQVFRAQIQAAITKSGSSVDIKKFCAAVVELPRPIPLSVLASVAQLSESLITDICNDLMPGIKSKNHEISLSDEDFESFLDEESRDLSSTVKKDIADHLWSTRSTIPYAATHVAAALLKAGRASDLVELIQTEKEPAIIIDPVLRREVQLQRLKLGIAICHELKAPVDAVKTLLIGTEAITTEDVIRNRLILNPDLAAACSAERASTLILRDPDVYPNHGALLYHLYRQDALRSDSLQARARERQLAAWNRRRSVALKKSSEDRYREKQEWPVSDSEIAADFEADLLLHGVEYALSTLRAWTPRIFLPAVLIRVANHLLASGRGSVVQDLYSCVRFNDAWKVFLYVPCAKARLAIPKDGLLRSLAMWNKRSLKFLWSGYAGREDLHRKAIAETLIDGCEIALSIGASVTSFQSLLKAFINSRQRQRETFSAYDAAGLDYTLRALAIQLSEVGQVLTAESYWLSPPDNEVKQSGHLDERKREQDSYINALCAVHAQRANLLLSSTTIEAATASLTIIQSSARLSDYELRRQYEARAVRIQTIRSLSTLLVVQSVDPKKLLDISLALMGEQVQYAGEDQLSALEFLRNQQELHEGLLRSINAWASNLPERKIPASERIDTMIRLARFVLPISQPSASAMFIKALNFANDIDEDVLLQIRVQGVFVDIARQGLDPLRKAQLGRDMLCVAGDAILRFDDIREFDWDNFAAILTRLNPSLALAAASRWEDLGMLHRDRLLVPAIVEGTKSGKLSAGHGSALLSLVEGRSPDSLVATAASCATLPESKRAAVAESLAWDDLFRFGQGYKDDVIEALKAAGAPLGRWSKALEATTSFVSSYQAGHPPNKADSSPPVFQPNIQWSEPIMFGNASELGEAYLKAEKEADRRGRRYEGDFVWDLIIERVPIAQRTLFLESVCETYRQDIHHSADRELVRAVMRWQDDPAIEEWCITVLPAFISRNLIELGKWVRYGHSVIHDLLRLSRLQSEQIVDLVLAGLATNADQLSASLALPLVELLAVNLGVDDAAILAEWYSERLVMHIPVKDRDLIDAKDVPSETHVGIARYLFALMTDVDTRIRWRAAHAFVRLALFNEHETIAALSAESSRTADPLFRQPDAPFYDLAGKLWFALAADQAAYLAPESMLALQESLWQLINNASIPHVLIRAFASSALGKLLKSGLISLSSEEKATLKNVNKAAHPPASKDEAVSETNEDDTPTKHRFDSMDTIPYWYRPIVNCFADVSMKEFLKFADNWVSEKWQVPPDIGIWKDEKRLNRFSDRDWNLWSNRHGSGPIIERPSTYYEWHAMWCVVGELLADRAPVKERDDWPYDNIYKQIAGELLTYPPTWLSSLRMPKPLAPQFWFEPSSSTEIDQWLKEPQYSFFVGELTKDSDPSFLIVEGHHEEQAPWFRSDISVRTALVSPDRAISLVRALSSADHYRYFVPPEGHNLEIKASPYELLGWLKNPDTPDPRVDGHDTFRAGLNASGDLPGSAISKLFHLKSSWPTDETIAGSDGVVVFTRERWSDDVPMNGERRAYSDQPTSKGERLLIRRESLKKFLVSEGLDLIVHVENTRANRGYDYGGSNRDEKRQTYNKHFVFRRNGTYEDAIGNSGTW